MSGASNAWLKNDALDDISHIIFNAAEVATGSASYIICKT